jgi:hypothetical protein
MDFEAFDEQGEIAMLVLLTAHASVEYCRKVRLENRQRHSRCIGGQTATPLGSQSGKPPTASP